MPVTRTCTFCGGDIEPGTGKMYVRRDGTVYYFCSSKCQKNRLNLGRLGRTTRWTPRYVQALRRQAPRTEAGVVTEEAEEAPPEEIVVEVKRAPEAGPVEEAEEVPAEMEVPTAQDREAVLQAFAELPGVGPAMAEALWEAGFTSLDAVRNADPEALTGVKGIGPATAEKVLAHLRGGS